MMWAGLIFREEIAVLPGSLRPAQLQSSANGVCSSMKVKYFGLVAGLKSVVKLLGSREKLRWSRQAGQWHCAVC